MIRSADRPAIVPERDQCPSVTLGVPPVEEEAFWGARVLTIRDPFGDNLRISEPVDATAHAHLPRWARSAN
jgi:hypothetical protein